MDNGQSSIFVSELPPNVKREDIYIYFQKPSNGGGEVNNVIYPLRPSGEALVIFDDPATARRAARFANHQLVVSSTKQAHPIHVRMPAKVFQRVSALLTREVVSVLKKWCGERWDKFLLSLIEDCCLTDASEFTNGDVCLEGSWFQVQSARQYVCDVIDKIEQERKAASKTVGAERQRRATDAEKHGKDFPAVHQSLRKPTQEKENITNDENQTPHVMDPDGTEPSSLDSFVIIPSDVETPNDGVAKPKRRTSSSTSEKQQFKEASQYEISQQADHENDRGNRQADSTQPEKRKKHDDRKKKETVSERIQQTTTTKPAMLDLSAKKDQIANYEKKDNTVEVVKNDQLVHKRCLEINLPAAMEPMVAEGVMENMFHAFIRTLEKTLSTHIEFERFPHSCRVFPEKHVDVVKEAIQQHFEKLKQRTIHANSKSLKKDDLRRLVQTAQKLNKDSYCCSQDHSIIVVSLDHIPDTTKLIEKLKKPTVIDKTFEPILPKEVAITKQTDGGIMASEEDDHVLMGGSTRSVLSQQPNEEGTPGDDTSSDSHNAFDTGDVSEIIGVNFYTYLFWRNVKQDDFKQILEMGAVFSHKQSDEPGGTVLIEVKSKDEGQLERLKRRSESLHKRVCFQTIPLNELPSEAGGIKVLLSDLNDTYKTNIHVAFDIDNSMILVIGYPSGVIQEVVDKITHHMGLHLTEERDIVTSDEGHSIAATADGRPMDSISSDFSSVSRSSSINSSLPSGKGRVNSLLSTKPGSIPREQNATKQTSMDHFSNRNDIQSSNSISQKFDKQKFTYVESFSKELKQLYTYSKEADIKICIKYAGDGLIEVLVTSDKGGDIDKVLDEIVNIFSSETKGLKTYQLDISESPLPGTEIDHVVNQHKSDLKDVLCTLSSSTKIVLVGPEDDALRSQLILRRDLKLPAKASSRHGRHSRPKKTDGNASSLSYTRKPPPASLRFKTPEGLNVEIYSADITKIQVEAITNAANGHLRHGGGVARAISKAAGWEFDKLGRDRVDRYGPIPVSGCWYQLATGTLLPHIQFVINSVGPQWADYEDKIRCLDLLRKAFMETLDCAGRLKVKAVAIPLISSGIYGVPKEKCAAELKQAILEFSGRSPIYLRAVHLVNIDEQTTETIIDEFQTKATSSTAVPPLPLYTYTTYEGLRVTMCTDDITKVNVAAIVNPSNTNLRHEAGISRAIASLSGYLFRQESDGIIRAKGQLMETDVVHQNSQGGLASNCFYVIHAVGPTNYNASRPESYMRALKRTFSNVFNYANLTVEVRSIAVPLIGTAAHGFPVVECVKVLRDAILEFSNRTKSSRILDDIFIVNNDPQVKEVAAEIFGLKSNKSTNDDNLKRNSATSGIGEERNSTKWESFARDMETKPYHNHTQCDWCEKANDHLVSVAACSHKFCNACTKGVVETQCCLICKSLSSGRYRFSTSSQRSPLTTMPCSKCKRRSATPMTSCHHVFCDGCFREVEGNAWKCVICQLFQDKLPSPTSFRSTLTLPTNVTTSENSSSFYPLDDFEPLNPRERKSLDPKADGRDEAATPDVNKEEDKCAICHDEISDPKVLEKCKHKFCRECIDEWFNHKPTCAVCGELYGVVTGTQPRNGRMTVKTDAWTTLSGHSRGAIIIDYSFTSGTQEGNHPNPGERYYGTSRRAYLPDTPEGRRVADLLKKAFDARLVFTIGRSVTTGADNVVTWNDIHHKTNRSGGPSNFGYPDSDYLKRVTEELRAKGIM